ncbi:putative small heat-shock protein [Hibiscus syriacus]|uniref:Small heat-shock protein n=1 Tax=Hibiscus syriacus TaxID=106335 RepID=A0A6A3A8T5_HIBSY|nr:putative small heat-shock protein [Hibiscus syriacus]
MMVASVEKLTSATTGHLENQHCFMIASVGINIYKMSSGCLGCCKKPIFKPFFNESSKGLKSQGHTVSKPSISEGFWTTSCDMDNSAVQSQGSISSISASNQTLDPNGSAASLLLWNQTRRRWVGNKNSENRPGQVREPKLNWNATYESLLGSNKPFPHPIPLSEMIDFLVEAWEQEGLVSSSSSLLGHNLGERSVGGVRRQRWNDEILKRHGRRNLLNWGTEQNDYAPPLYGEHKEEGGGGGGSDNDDSWSAGSYGFYNISLVLPDDVKVDDIKAELKDGVLSIIVPKTEQSKKDVKQVQIN